MKGGPPSPRSNSSLCTLIEEHLHSNVTDRNSQYGRLVELGRNCRRKRKETRQFVDFRVFVLATHLRGDARRFATRKKERTIEGESCARECENASELLFCRENPEGNVGTTNAMTTIILVLTDLLDVSFRSALF